MLACNISSSLLRRMWPRWGEGGIEEEEGVRGPFLCGEIVAFIRKPLLSNVQIMKDTQLSGSQEFIFIVVLGIQQLIRAYNSIPH